METGEGGACAGFDCKHAKKGHLMGDSDPSGSYGLLGLGKWDAIFYSNYEFGHG